MASPEGPPVGPAVIATVSVFFALSTTTTVLRVWARELKGKRLSFNDYAITVALGIQLGQGAAILYGCVHRRELRRLGQAMFATELLWATAITFVKLSVLHLYLQIFPVQRFCCLVRAFIALVIAFWLSIVLQRILLCALDDGSSIDIAQYGCLRRSLAHHLLLGMDLFLNVAIVVLPMRLIWSLRMPRAKRLWITSMFGLGSIICAVSLTRIIIMGGGSQPGAPQEFLQDAILSNLEPDLGIITACLPVLQPVVRHVWGSEHLPATISRHSVMSQLRKSNLRGRFKRTGAERHWPIQHGVRNFAECTDNPATYDDVHAFASLGLVYEHAQGRVVLAEPRNAIVVTHSWNVE